MKRLFISQPMKGKTDEEILKEREKAIASARRNFAENEEIEVIDSFFQSAPADARPLWFLGKSLELLSKADIAYFAKGWENARGCRIENTCAIEYFFRMRLADVDIEKGATADDLKAFLSKNPITVYYAASTPIRTPLPPETIAAYKALRTYSPTTTVINDACAGMSVGYKRRK